VAIDDLCTALNASLATIRRDLDDLENRSLLRRTRGGAVPIGPLFYEPFRHDTSFQDMVSSFAEEKRRIARAAADLVQPGTEQPLVHRTGSFRRGTGHHPGAGLDPALGRTQCGSRDTEGAAQQPGTAEAAATAARQHLGRGGALAGHGGMAVDEGKAAVKANVHHKLPRG